MEGKPDDDQTTLSTDNNSVDTMRKTVTDYRHCAETQDHRLEGSKTASTPPYILLAD